MKKESRSSKRFSRRKFLKSSAAAATTAVAFPHIRNAAAATPTIRNLQWNYVPYNDIPGFEAEYGCKIESQFFDGNAQAYNKMKLGGTEDFDVVMADGFWPRQYLKSGLIQPIDQSKLTNLEYVHKEFLPEGGYDLLHDKEGTRIGSHQCWGSYGITANTSRIGEGDRTSLIRTMWNENYSQHIATSARFEENIANAGIIAAHQLGTKDDPRPDGNPFNPYIQTEEELVLSKELLIQQKPLVLMRFVDQSSAEALMRSGAVWAFQEWANTYRTMKQAYWAGDIDFDVSHALQPEEGGLGWIDSYQLSSGTTDSELIELIHHWFNWILKPENQHNVAVNGGTSPCVDVSDMLTAKEAELMMSDRVDELHGLYMFDQPSDPERWEKIWSEVQAA